MRLMRASMCVRGVCMYAWDRKQYWRLWILAVAVNAIPFAEIPHIHQIFQNILVKHKNWAKEIKKSKIHIFGWPLLLLHAFSFGHWWSNCSVVFLNCAVGAIDGDFHSRKYPIHVRLKHDRNGKIFQWIDFIIGRDKRYHSSRQQRR